MGKKEKVGVFAILIGIITFHIINNYIILNNNLLPFLGDSAKHIGLSFKLYLFLLESKFFDIYSLNGIGESYGVNYPFLFFSLSSPFYWLFGLSQKSALMTNFIFIAVLVFSVYGIGKFLHSKGAGILAAFIVMSFPGVFALSRTYLSDFASVAMVALSICFLLKTQMFTQRKSSIFLGLATGLGMAIRPSFIIFFLGPFCYYLFISFKQRNDRQVLFGKIKNFIIFLAISVFLIGFFYFQSFSGKIGHQIFAMFHFSSNSSKYFSLENILFYIKGVFGGQILYFYFIIFLLSAVLFLKSNKKYKPLLFLWLLIPYLFFTFCVLNNKELRFIAPSLPVASLIISISLLDIQKLNLKKALIFLIVFVGLFQFILISYIPVAGVLIDNLNQKFFDIPYSYFTSMPDAWGRVHAYKTDYSLGIIADYIAESDRFIRQDQIKFIDVAGGFTRPLLYMVYQNDIGLLKKDFQYQSTLLGDRYYAPESFKQLPKDTDFIVLSSKFAYDFPELNDFILENMKLVKKINLVEGEVLYIFEKKTY